MKNISKLSQFGTVDFFQVFKTKGFGMERILEKKFHCASLLCCKRVLLITEFLFALAIYFLFDLI